MIPAPSGFIEALLGTPGPSIARFSPRNRATLVREGLWVPFLQACLQQGLELPAEYRHELFEAISWQLACSHALKELAEACSESGISIVAFKGCALALSTYASLGQRVFGDVDICVRPEHHSRFVTVAEALGYEVSPLRNLVSRDPVFFDLHQHPLHQFKDFLAVPGDDWWLEAVPLSQATGQSLRLTRKHEFILALFHGAKHAFSRSNWLVDLILLARSMPEQEVVGVVRTYRAQRHLWFANECARELLGVEFPEPIKAIGKATLPLDLFSRRLLHLIRERRAPEYLGMLTPLWALPGIPAKLRYLWRQALPDPSAWKTRLPQIFEMMRRFLLG